MVQHLRIPDLFKKSGISIGVSFISNPTVISHQSSVISQQSLVNSQQSTVNSQQARTVQPESIFLNLQLPNFNSTILRAADESFAQKPDRHGRNRARMCV